MSQPSSPRALLIASGLVALCCVALAEFTGWRTGICCFAAAPLTPGSLPESHSKWQSSSLDSSSGGGFGPWMTHSWDESYKNHRREDAILKRRGIPWLVRKFLRGIKGSPRFKMEGDAVVMMTKLVPLGLVVSMKYPPKHKAIITEKDIPLPGFTVKDKTVTYKRGKSLVTESTTTLPTGEVVKGMTVASLDEKSDELVIDFTPGEKGEAPWRNRFKRGKKV